MVFKRVIAAMALVLALMMMVGVFVPAVDAQSKDKEDFNRKNDKKLAQKEGVSGSLASSDDDEDTGEGPTKFQMGVGVASIFVMIAVVKWL